MNLQRRLSQGLFLAGAMAFIGYFSAAPVYTHMPTDMAMVKVSFSHGAERVEPCVKRTREELMALPPNMRKPMSCSRARLPLIVQVILDGKEVVDETLPPIGIAKDGKAKIYRRINVEPGMHTLYVGIRDSRRKEGYDYVFEERVRLEPRQNLVVDFHGDKGIFLKNGEAS
jgi:hypothetical protein